MSAGVDAATASLNKAADAADSLDQTVTRVGPSATSLARRYDDVTSSAAKLTTAQNNLRNGTATMDAGVAAGTVTVQQRNAVVDSLSGKVQALTAATAASLPATAQMTASNNSAAVSAGGAALAHAGFTREIVVLGHEILSGNYSRIPGSMVVLAERSGELNNIISTMGSLIFGLPGAAAAAAIGLGVMGYEAESNARQLLTLQTALKATRDDFTTMASEANLAAKAVASSTGFSTSDTRAAAQTIVAVPSFTGSQQQLQALIVEAGDLGTVMGETLPAAAQKLAAAMQDPGKAAQDLADIHFKGMNQALVDSIALQAAAGDKAGAFATYLGVVQTATSGAANASKTELQQALSDLGKAFTGTGADGQSFADVLGKAVTGAASDAVEALASVVSAINTARGHLAAGDVSSSSPYAFSPNAGSPAPIGAPTLGPVTSTGEQAVGLYQVMPSTAAGLGYSASDLASTGGNIQAGIAVLLQKYFQAGGNVDQTLALYGGYGKDTTAAATYISSVNNANPASLDPATLAAIQQATAAQHLPANLAMLAERIPVVESSGRQFAAPTTAAAATATAPLGADFPVPPIPPTTADANGLSNNDIVNQAVKAADSAGTATTDYSKAAASVKLYSDALSVMASQGDTSSASVLKVQDALAKAQVTMQDAIAPAQKLLDTTSRQTAGLDDITAAYSDGMAAVDHMTNLVKAEEAARAFAAVGTAQYIAMVDALTAKYDANTAAQQRNAAAGQISDQNKQLDYLNEELATLGETADIRAKDLAVFQAEQTIAKSMPDITAEQKSAYIANAAAIAAATANLQQQQQVISDISGMMTQAFDQVGSAITQAFVNGNGAAVNFGNVTRGIIASVVQEIAKMAIIAPIINSLGGSHQTTLGDLLSLGTTGASAVAGTSSGSSGSSSLSDLSSYLGLGGSLSSISGALGGPSIGSMLGLTGEGGLFSGASSGGLLTGLLNTQLIEGAGYTGSITGGATGLGGVSSASLGTGATVGGALAGVGGGFALGSLAGGYVQSSMGKVGPAPEIGAATGALAGAAIGSIIPGVGTVIGGIVGGLIGGGGGGLIGPAAPSTYGGASLSVDSSGMLQFGVSSSQGEDNSGNVTTAQSDAASVDAFLQANGLKITQAGTNSSGVVANSNTPGTANPGGVQWIGTGTTPGDPNFYSDLDTPNATTGKTLFSQFQFQSSDPLLNQNLQGQSFNSSSDLVAAVQAFQTAEAAVSTFLTGTVPALTASATATGSYATALQSTSAPYDAAIAQAKALAASGAATADQNAALVQSENDLTTARDKATQAVTDALNATLTQQYNGYIASEMSAQATISGNPADAEKAALYAFDQQASQQTAALDAQLKSVYGDSVTTTEGYVGVMALLETSLGEQRLAIQQQYNDQLTAAATTGVQSLASEVLKLQTGSASPLSPSAQYSLASNQFNAVAGAAQAGDWTSYQNISSYADSLLSASQAYNGSGTAYTADFNRVLDVLSNLASESPDTLTASIYTAQTQTQTQILADGQQQVVAAIDALRLAVQQGSAAPNRLG
jgi:trimeric autotransporter adhesin